MRRRPERWNGNSGLRCLLFLMELRPLAIENSTPLPFARVVTKKV